jgi:hypothetical protein
MACTGDASSCGNARSAAEMRHQQGHWQRTTRQVGARQRHLRAHAYHGLKKEFDIAKL